MRSFAILGFSALFGMVAVKTFGLLPCVLAAFLLSAAAFLPLLRTRLPSRFSLSALLAAIALLLCCLLYPHAPRLTDGATVSFDAVVLERISGNEEQHAYAVRITALGEDKLDIDGVLRCADTLSPYERIRGVAKLRVGSNSPSLTADTPVSHLGVQHSLAYFGSLMRNAVRERVRPLLRAADFARLNGMLFGDAGDLSDADRLTFSRAGISHIFAVSGLHIAVFNGLFLSLLALFGVSARRRAALSLPLLLLLAMFTGFSQSVLRAVLMAASVNLGALVRRRSDSLNSLGFAVFCILLCEPDAVQDLSFWLTVFSTLGILLLLPRLHRWIRRLPVVFQPSAEAAAVTASAFAGTLPVMLFSFDELSLIGIPVNLLLSQIFPILLPLCLVTALLATIPILTGLAELCGHGCAVLFRLIDRVCHAAVEIPFAYLPIGFSFLRVWFALTVAFLLCAVLLRRRFPYIRVNALLLSGCLLCGLILSEFQHTRRTVVCTPIQSTYAGALLIQNRGQTILLTFDEDRWLAQNAARVLRARGIRSLSLVAGYDDLSRELEDAAEVRAVVEIDKQTVGLGIWLSDAVQLEITDVSGKPCAVLCAYGTRVFLPNAVLDDPPDGILLSPYYPNFTELEIPFSGYG